MFRYMRTVLTMALFSAISNTFQLPTTTVYVCGEEIQVKREGEGPRAKKERKLSP